MIGLPANVRYTKHFAQQPLEAFMRGLKTLMLALSCLSAVATAADIAPTTKLKPLPDIRQSGFIYCVSGILNTFNPQMASSGLTVDTLAAQLLRSSARR